MSNKEFYKFSENNDNEGEIWHFYFPMTKEEALHFWKIISEAESTAVDYNFPYIFENEIVPEAEVDVLVKHTDSGYMDTHNKQLKTIKPILELTINDFLEDDIFYKGAFFD